MDNIQSKLANVSLYDVKAYVRKAQNAVLNFSDMEAKVREATNNEPWGTPTSVMQEIADGTQSYQHFHEIMPFVYRRFTEKSASQWRQIYKALTLLDYLVKNGSERVVDYARSHTAVIEMLKHFHYESHTGEDRGAGIRRRAEELLSLLGNIDLIRSERKKARALNQKTGVSTSGGLGSGGGSGYSGYTGYNSGSGSRSGSASANYGRSARAGAAGSGRGDSGQPGSRGGIGYDSGMTSGSWGAAPGDGVYGGGAVTGNYHSSTSVNNLSQSNDDFEEYDVGPSNKGSTTKKPIEEDDDFADFQSAPVSGNTTPKPSTTDSILDLFSNPPSASAASVPAAQGTQATAAVPASNAAASSPSLVSGSFAAAPIPSSFSTSVNTSTSSSSPAKPKDDIFGSLWESSKSASHNSKPAPMSSAKPTPVSSSFANGSTGSTGNNGINGSNSNGSNTNNQVEDLLLR